MARYPVRPWYHPVQFMASSPIGYACLTVVIPMCILFPWRYKISRFFERQKDSPQQCLRQKAIRTYRELERMYRREAMYKHPFILGENEPNKNATTQQATSFQIGVTDQERQYWDSHMKDVTRAARLQDEIKALRLAGVTDQHVKEAEAQL